MFGRVKGIDKGIPAVKCICPNCGCKHKVQMKWIGGNVTPRVYCDSCRGLSCKLPSGTEEYSIPKGSGD